MMTDYRSSQLATDIMALLPNIIMASILSLALSMQGLMQTREDIEQYSQQLANHLSNNTRIAINDGSIDNFQSIATNALDNAHLLGIQIYDASGEPVANAGIEQTPIQAKQLNSIIDTNAVDQAQHRNIITAVRVSQTNQIDSVPEALNPAVLAWVQFKIDVRDIKLHAYRHIFINLLLIFFCFLISCYITYRRRFRERHAHANLLNSLNRIADGDLESPIKTDPQILTALSSALEHARSEVLKEKENAKLNVEQTTSDLRETLETIEIQNIELDLARKEAIEASRIKSEFLANTSHEIRTPLNGIIGFTRLLQKAKLDIQQQDYLATILQSSEGLMTIINDILDFSKIEAGKLVLDNSPINLRDIIEDTFTILAPTAQEKGLELVLMIDGNVPDHVSGDSIRIKQIITNLISNAIKFTPKGHILTRIGLEELQASSAHINFSVTDTGIGMSHEQRQNLFESFTQASSSTAREYGGTGLGLTISKRLIEQMGGTIGIDSNLGSGSTFFFSIRLELQNKDGDKDNLLPVLSDKRYALIDQSEAQLLALNNMLGEWQAEVETVTISPHDSKTYINLFDSNYDGLIFGLPAEKESYRAMLKLLEQTPLSANFPVFALFPSNNSLLQFEDHNPQIHCLSKPVNSTKLKRLMLGHDILTPEVDAGDSKRHIAIQTKILCVDDNEANLKLINALLCDLSLKPILARNGREAIELVQQQDFDLIFMDIQMPEIDGIEATRRIREMAGKKSLTPIVALTAHALSDEKRRLLEAGLNDHITKPINEQQIIDSIRRWTMDSPSSKEVNAQPAHINDDQAILQLPPSTRPVDIERCIKLANNKVDLAQEMLSMLIDNIGHDAKDIAEAFIANDYERQQTLVHKLHGACCYTGVPRLQLAADEYETVLKQQLWSNIPSAYEALINEVDHLLAWADMIEISLVFEA